MMYRHFFLNIFDRTLESDELLLCLFVFKSSEDQSTRTFFDIFSVLSHKEGTLLSFFFLLLVSQMRKVLFHIFGSSYLRLPWILQTSSMSLHIVLKTIVFIVQSRLTSA